MSEQYKFDVTLQSKDFEVKIDTEAKYGYFEHNDLGDECGGGLWFDKCEYAHGDFLALSDYDGVFSLPKQVRDVLVANDFYVSVNNC